jgi:hypothetical protein
MDLSTLNRISIGGGYQIRVVGNIAANGTNGLQSAPRSLTT